jgi:hypothetical protein
MPWQSYYSDTEENWGEGILDFAEGGMFKEKYGSG